MIAIDLHFKSNKIPINEKQPMKARVRECALRITGVHMTGAASPSENAHCPEAHNDNKKGKPLQGRGSTVGFRNAYHSFLISATDSTVI